LYMTLQPGQKESLEASCPSRHGHQPVDEYKQNQSVMDLETVAILFATRSSCLFTSTTLHASRQLQALASRGAPPGAAPSQLFVRKGGCVITQDSKMVNSSSQHASLSTRTKTNAPRVAGPFVLAIYNLIDQNMHTHESEGACGVTDVKYFTTSEHDEGP
jgi:hypothetical protein